MEDRLLNLCDRSPCFVTPCGQQPDVRGETPCHIQGFERASRDRRTSIGSRTPQRLLTLCCGRHSRPVQNHVLVLAGLSASSSRGGLRAPTISGPIARQSRRRNCEPRLRTMHGMSVRDPAGKWPASGPSEESAAICHAPAWSTSTSTGSYTGKAGELHRAIGAANGRLMARPARRPVPTGAVPEDLQHLHRGVGAVFQPRQTADAARRNTRQPGHPRDCRSLGRNRPVRSV